MLNDPQISRFTLGLPTKWWDRQKKTLPTRFPRKGKRIREPGSERRKQRRDLAGMLLDESEKSPCPGKSQNGLRGPRRHGTESSRKQTPRQWKTW